MRDLTYLNKHRFQFPEVSLPKGTTEDDLDPKCNGAFVFLLGGAKIVTMATRCRGWEHVSVSLIDRCPTWNEMSVVKKIFFEDHEIVMQLHVSEENHINDHPFCLHLWKPVSKMKAIPLPPKDLV